MSEIIAFFLDLYLDIKHWCKVRKRRKFEKKNKLPKKRIISTSNKIGIVLLILSIPFFYLRFKRIKNSDKIENLNKIVEIGIILEEEKKHLGYYPNKLKKIIRNNPLRKNIALDYWKSYFLYEISKDSLNYKITSAGKDKILNTLDDVSFSPKKFN